MKNKYFRILVTACLLAVACETESPTPVTVSLQSNVDIQNNYLTLIKEMGLSDKDIVDRGEHFVVEGDIVVYKADLDKRMKKGSSGHQRHEFIVSESRALRIGVRIDPALASMPEYATAVSQVVAYLDGVNGVTMWVVDNSASADITIYPDNAINCPPSHKHLTDEWCGLAGVPTGDGAPFPTISINADHSALTNLAEKRLLIVHELLHCVGLLHTDEGFGTLIPETPLHNDESSVMNANICGEEHMPGNFDRIAIGELYKDGTVSSGTSNDLDYYKPLRGLIIAPHVVPNTIVGAGFASDNHSFTWYADGKASSGYSNCLDAYTPTARYPVSLPAGKTFSQIVDVAIGNDNKCYAYYSDGTYSVGTSDDLDYYSAPASYSLPPGKTYSQIVGIDVATSNYFYVWFVDGTVSAGKANDLDFYVAPYNYTIAPGKAYTDIVGVGIATDDRCYVWYKREYGG
jgi:hypothetical protein